MTISSENKQDYTNNINGGLAAEVESEFGDCLFTEDEIKVANILLDLPYLITKSLSIHRFPYNWSTKKRRSALVSPPSPLPSHRKISPPHPVVKAEASSPTTPLSFSPSHSESDSKFKRSAKKKTPGLNLRKEELEEILREKMLTHHQLKQSIGKVREYLNALTTEHSKLLGRKQELLGLKVMTPTPSPCTTQMQQQETTTAVNDRVHAVPSTSTEFHHQIPLISPHHRHGVNECIFVGPSTSTQYHQAPWINRQVVVVNDPVSAGLSTSTQFPYPPPLINHQNQQYAIFFNQGDQIHHHQQQFDLNIEPEPVDARAMAAAARQKRFYANMEKKTRGKKLSTKS